MNHIAAMKHLKVPFDKGTIRAISDTTGWAGRHQGNFFEAWGPCPRCHARIEGSTVAVGVVSDNQTGNQNGNQNGNILGRPFDGSDREPDPREVQVDVECGCGHPHGAGTSGCGFRGWVRFGDLS